MAETRPRTLSTLSTLSSASKFHESNMTDTREASSSPRTLPSTSAASEDVASADSSFQTLSATGEVGDKLPKSSPEVISIDPGIQHPAFEPTEAPFFAHDPYVDRLPASIVEFYLNKDTISAPALVTVPLSIADFHRYEDDIVAYVHKRFDYDPETQEITFRMTTPTHDIFAKYVEDAILKELRKLDEGHYNFVADIQTVGNARIKLVSSPNAVGASGSDTESKWKQKGPDVQFHHKLTDIPTVILEVAYTQKAKELRQLAHEYIKGSGGMVKVVVGLNIKSNKKSTISIWRTRIEVNGETGRERVHIDNVVDSDVSSFT